MTNLVIFRTNPVIVGNNAGILLSNPVISRTSTFGTNPVIFENKKIKYSNF